MVELIPSVNVYRGKVISEPEGTILDKKPIEFIRKLLEKHEKALIFDLDGIQRNKPQWPILKKLETKELWIDAGVRTADSIIELFISGAGKVLLSTSSLWHRKELDDAFKLSENLMFRIALEDTSELKVMGRKFQIPLKDLLYELREVGIRELLLSGAVGSIALSAKTVDSALNMVGSEQFDVFIAIHRDYEKNRLESSGIKGVVVDAGELV